jgi:hypothetical protein
MISLDFFGDCSEIEGTVGIHRSVFVMIGALISRELLTGKPMEI